MRATRIRMAVLPCALVLLAWLVPQEVASTSSVQGGGAPANPTLLETRKQCSNVTAYFTVDPDIASQWVPPPFQLLIDAQGLAAGAFVVFDCPEFQFHWTPNSPPLEQGENMAPQREAHFWVMLQGPPQVLPVPGATVTAPTQYAYAVADLVTSVVLHRLYRRAGKNAILVSDITLVDQGSAQTGEITFTTGSRIMFTANTPTQLPTPLRLGGNVWNWHVGGGGEMGEDSGVTLDPAAGNASSVNVTRIQFLSLVPGPPNTTQVTIQAEPGTGFPDYYGTSTVASVRATFFRLNNIVNNSSRGDLAWTTYPPSLIPVPPVLPLGPSDDQS